MDAITGPLLGPFLEFEFMRRALVGVMAIALGGAPVGVFLMLRRMSLTGDAMAHAILPGAAVGYLVAGLSLPAMTLGGLVAGVVVAVLAGLVARVTALKEDASLAAFYLLSLALGVVIVSLRGSNTDLLHVLFGTVLALDDAPVFIGRDLQRLEETLLHVLGCLRHRDALRLLPQILNHLAQIAGRRQRRQHRLRLPRLLQKSQGGLLEFLRVPRGEVGGDCLLPFRRVGRRA